MSRSRVALAVTIALAIMIALPMAAHAAEAPKSRAATGTYDLDFTLPTAGKSGCEVCHADKNLVRVVDGETISMYVDSAALRESAHAKIACTQCHLDFAYTTPHKNAADGEAWKAVANSSCKSSGCHPQQYEAINLGAHSAADRGQEGITVSGGEKERKTPTCGDCHGGHDIQPITDNPEEKAALHARGLEMCGECHEDETGTYRDNYHGAAYQRGAEDAPACWQCHNAHDVYPSDDRRSPTSANNLTETCGGSAANGAACHTDVSEQFVSYSEAIHGKDKVLEENPAWSFVVSVKTRIGVAIDSVRSMF